MGFLHLTHLMFMEFPELWEDVIEDLWGLIISVIYPFQL